MHHKRHAMEILDLFKQSRALGGGDGGGSKTAAPPDRPLSRFQVDELEPEREEVVMGKIPEPDSERLPVTAASVSYLPKITPIPKKKPTGMTIRRDTVIVGAVFFTVLTGLSFLLGRHTNLGGATPPTAVPEAQPPALQIPVESSALVAPASIVIDPSQGFAAERQASQPAAIPGDLATTASQPEAPVPPKTVGEKTAESSAAAAETAKKHVYQLATTGQGKEGERWAEKYREFLLGNGFEGFAYKTQSGWWTVRVHSTDESEADLGKIKQLVFEGHRPFGTGYRLRLK